MRTAKYERKTKETDISVEICLDGGEIEVSTGIGFFDHMLNSFAKHSGFGLKLKAVGDLEIDGHHTVEDVGIVLGKALLEALGGRENIARYGTKFIPMDESIAFCSVDVSGRPFLVFEGSFEEAVVGEFDTCLTEEFFRAFAFNAGITMHISIITGSNAHHMIEAMFKAAAHAIKEAVVVTSSTLSTKGCID
ncbi:MAG: imidazoleglycerol-phosphate dehydratase HisB [Clostridia bacterium]|nr:imidazoleglycerol-phosphate dehydratase HisB [Clostridia bacterium]